MWYFGKGRAAELVDEKAATDFNLLIVDDELAPNQQRSLESCSTARSWTDRR